MPKYIVLYNGEPLKTFELDEPVITIGRLPENTISIANMGISRRHARIEEDSDRNLVLTDLNSLNGTFVNSRKVKKVNLQDGDQISIGKYVIIFSKGNDGPATETTASSAALQNIAAPGEPPLDDLSEKNSNRSSNAPTGAQPAVGSEENIKENSHSAVLIETNKHVVYKIDKPYMTLGSGESDDIFVSGFLIGEGQVALESREDGVYISAQKLMGKVKVNGHPVKVELLKHKDRIEVGAHTFRFMENG